MKIEIWIPRLLAHYNQFLYSLIAFYNKYKFDLKIIQNKNVRENGIVMLIGSKSVFLDYSDDTFFLENPIFGIGVGSGKFKRMEDEENMVAASHNEIGRLLSEHGLIGLFLLIMLLMIPIFHFIKIDNFNRAWIISFFLLWFLTINHSAMRLAFPGFIYGLSLLTIKDNLKKDTNEQNR